jgi:hypothetical protein
MLARVVGSCGGVLGRVEQLGKLEAYSDGVEQGDTGRERRDAQRHRGTIEIFWVFWASWISWDLVVFFSWVRLAVLWSASALCNKKGFEGAQGGLLATLGYWVQRRAHRTASGQ